MGYQDNSGLPKQRPQWITTICILAIVFGAVGLLSGGIGLVSQLFASRLQSAVVNFQQSSNLPGAEFQREALTRTMAIATKYNFALIPLGIAKIGVEALLLAGGILSLKLKVKGRSLLLAALVGALIVESTLIVPRIMQQRETQAAMADLMPKVMAAGQSSDSLPPGLNTGMSSMYAGMATVAIYSAIAWLLVKIVIYLIGINYLRKPQTVALFDNG